MLSPLIQSHLNGNLNKNGKRSGKTRPPRSSKQEIAAVKSMLMQELLASGGQQRLRRAPKRGNKRPRTSGQNPPNDTGNKTRYQNRNVTRGNQISNFGMRGEMKRLPSFTEQISQPLSSAAWALFKSYSINPGQVAIFPVASVEAQQWQKYRFRRFRVIYEPLINEFNTNNDGAGEITIGFDPDASDQPPTTFSQAINSKPVARGRPCDKIVLEIPKYLLQAQMDAHFVRHGNLPGGADIKTYDIGLVNISVVGSGTTGSTILGNIYFEYELDLLTQQIALNTSAPANNQVANFTNPSSAATLATSTVPLVIPLATVVTNGIAVVNTAGSLVPPPGNYLVTAQVRHIFTGLATVTSSTLIKNSTNLEPGANFTFTSGVMTTVSEFLDAFVACNGTDAITLSVTDTFSTGTDTVVAVIIFTAV